MEGMRMKNGDLNTSRTATAQDHTQNQVLTKRTFRQERICKKTALDLRTFVSRGFLSTPTGEEKSRLLSKKCLELWH